MKNPYRIEALFGSDSMMALQSNPSRASTRTSDGSRTVYVLRL